MLSPLLVGFILFIVWLFINPLLKHATWYNQYGLPVDDVPSLVNYQGANRLNSPEFAPFSVDGAATEAQLLRLLLLMELINNSNEAA
jgi:hypothetical protein